MSTTEPLWQRALPVGLMSCDEAHVWRAYLDLDLSQIENLIGTLSADEVERSRRFRFEKDERRFIAARGMLRNILAGYLGMNAQKIQFEYAPQGKPKIPMHSNRSGLQFSVSHSGTFVLYAIALDRRIGVDIELIRHDVAVEEIASKFFSQREVGSLERSDSGKLRELFFQYWTRKEAILKAMGQGFSFPMEKVDVSFIGENGSGCVVLSPHQQGSTRWYLQDLFTVPGYIASVAIEGRDCSLSCFEYSIE